MNEQTYLEAIRFPRVWWCYLLSFMFASVGFQSLFYFKDSWFPSWIQGLFYIVFFVLSVVNLGYMIYHVNRNIGAYKLSWRTGRVVLKPYILWASVALMILSWVVALIFYNALWFFVALGTTFLVFIVGFFSIRKAIHRSEPSDLV